MLVYQPTLRARVFLAHVLICLACLRAHVVACLTCLRLACMCLLPAYVQTCLSCLLCSNILLVYVLVCLVFSFVICFIFQEFKFQKFFQRKICIVKLNIFFLHRYQFTARTSFVINDISKDVFRALSSLSFRSLTPKLKKILE